MNLVRFVKMHGAGNDFALIDDRDGTFPARGNLIAALAAPRTGIGCEGVILVQRAAAADFKMSFYNPDGSEADLCGNGARCVAAFAREIGAVTRDTMVFETRAGRVDAELVGPGLVRVWMPDPDGRRYGVTAAGVTGDFIVAGVPHFIVRTENLAAVDVEAEGRRLRLAAEFAPAGTNVDFVTYRAPDRAFMRTYERGVEGESGGCGTGAMAAAVVGVEKCDMSLPMRIRTSQGYELTVEGDYRQAQATGFALVGPVRRVFAGEIDLDALEIEA